MLLLFSNIGCYSNFMFCLYKLTMYCDISQCLTFKEQKIRHLSSELFSCHVAIFKSCINQERVHWLAWETERIQKFMLIIHTSKHKSNHTINIADYKHTNTFLFIINTPEANRLYICDQNSDSTEIQLVQDNIVSKLTILSYSHGYITRCTRTPLQPYLPKQTKYICVSQESLSYSVCVWVHVYTHICSCL